MTPSAFHRRAMLQGGLAAFAALVARSIPGCSSSEPAATPPTPDGGDPDAPSGDAGNAGNEFPNRGVARPAIVSKIGAIGALGAADPATGVRLPAGFSIRVVAEAGKPPRAQKPDYLWHVFPDGGATFGTEDGGWIYVSNSEFPLDGGVGALRFDASGALVDAYPILTKTNVNCAGGPTPWGTWLSCEEIERGKVYECDPRGELPAVVRPALGTFQHEAVAVDPVKHHLYLTEDVADGRFYRYTPARLAAHGGANLAEGTLEAAQVAADGKVTWLPISDPTYEGNTPTRKQASGATVFSGGEGIWWHAGVVTFSTKGDNRLRAYDTASETMRVVYDGKDPILTGVDNITVSASGDVLVAEDGGSMEIVAILPSGELKVILAVDGQDKSEIAGPAFDPSGTRLYFSSQRGGAKAGGITYEVTGPFHAPA